MDPQAAPANALKPLAGRIGREAVILCGPGAASITGAALPVDGGSTAQ